MHPKKFLNLSLFILFAAFCILIALYPLVYLLNSGKIGILQWKTDRLLSDVYWNICFYTHITMGGIALLVGWMNFIKKWRQKYLKFHQVIGRVYVIAVWLSSLASIYISFFANGGLIASLGFFCLGIIWFATTTMAYFFIIKGEIQRHQQIMLYSYAACFGAVTLRIWNPIFMMLTHNPTTSYQIVAWLSWVPNLVVAYMLVIRLKSKNRALASFNNAASIVLQPDRKGYPADKK